MSGSGGGDGEEASRRLAAIEFRPDEFRQDGDSRSGLEVAVGATR